MIIYFFIIDVIQLNFVQVFHNILRLFPWQNKQFSKRSLTHEAKSLNTLLFSAKIKMGMFIKRRPRLTTRVFRFQAAGWGHQPPVGDQTHLG
jgi:hypothetical protein